MRVHNSATWKMGFVIHDVESLAAARVAFASLVPEYLGCVNIISIFCLWTFKMSKKQTLIPLFRSYPFFVFLWPLSPPPCLLASLTAPAPALLASSPVSPPSAPAVS